MIFMNNMKKKFEYVIVAVFLFTATAYMGFSQTKIDTVYIKYLGSTINTSKDSASFYRVRTITGNTLQATDFDIKDSSIKCSGYYKKFYPYIREGFFVFYSPVIEGNMLTGRLEGNYVNDKEEGVWKYYYDSGELCFTQTFVKGTKTGLLQGYYKTGELKRTEEYKDGSLISCKCYTKSGADTVCCERITRATFPGGEKAMIEYLRNDIKYPKQAQREKIQGIVYVKFYINPDGSIGDAEVIRGKGVHLLLDNEAIECVKRMPAWIPGTIEGHPVKMSSITRIKFQLVE